MEDEEEPNAGQLARKPWPFLVEIVKWLPLNRRSWIKPKNLKMLGLP